MYLKRYLSFYPGKLDGYLVELRGIDPWARSTDPVIKTERVQVECSTIKTIFASLFCSDLMCNKKIKG